MWSGRCLRLDPSPAYVNTRARWANLGYEYANPNKACHTTNGGDREEVQSAECRIQNGNSAQLGTECERASSPRPSPPEEREKLSAPASTWCFVSLPHPNVVWRG